MQVVVGFRGSPLAGGEVYSSKLQQHRPIGCGDFGGAGRKGSRLLAPFEIHEDFSSWGRNYTGVRSRRAWSSSTLLAAGPLLMPRLILCRADDSRGDDHKREKRKQDVKKEWTSIPSTIYRPFTFPNVEEYVRELNSSQRVWHAVGFLATLAAVAWARNLGVAGLVDDSEPLFVEAARQMILTGDYITPKFNALPLLDKPILIYWFMALSAKIFGDKVWAYRLPSCLLAMGLLAVLYRTVLQFGLRLSSELNRNSEETLSASSEEKFLPAIITASAFAMNLGVMAWGSAALSDMLSTASVGASLLSFFWGYAGRDHSPSNCQNHYFLSAAFLGLTCLSNGPSGVIFALCVCASFLLCTGDLKQVFMNEVPVVKGILIVAMINLPWYGMTWLRYGVWFLNTSFNNFSIEQFVRGIIHQHGVRPWWFGLATVVIMYFPWSLSLPAALLKANPCTDSGRWKQNSRGRKLVLFAAIWLLSGFSLLALTASQLSSYLLVAPAIALLAAAHLSLPARLHENGMATGLAPAIIYQILAGVFFLVPGVQQGSALGIFAVLGTFLVSKDHNLIAFVILAVAGMLATRTEEYSVAYGSKHMPSDENGSGVAEYSVDVKTLLPLWLLHTVAMLAFLGLYVTPSFRLVDSVRQAPVRELALRAAQVRQPGEELLMVRVNMPSVVYYSQLPTSFFDSFAEAAINLEKSSVVPESVLVISDEVWESSLESKDLCQTEGYRLTRVILPKEKISP